MPVPLGELLPLTLVVQALVAVVIYFGGKGKQDVDKDGVDIFRFQPFIAWTITALSFAVSMLLLIIILRWKPTSVDAPLAFMLGQLLFFLFGTYGIYGIQMRILIDPNTIRVKKFNRINVFRFGEIGAVDDRKTGRYRTLDVRTTLGKRVIHVTSTLLPEYDRLVDILNDGRRKHSINKAE